MDPLTIYGLASGGAGLLGGLFDSFGRKSSDFKITPDTNGEAYKQYKKFSDLNSDFYRTGETRLKRFYSDMVPTADSMITASRANGMSYGGSSYLANQQRKEGMRTAMDKAGSSLLDLYQMGQTQAKDYLGMSYDNAKAEAMLRENQRNKQTSLFAQLMGLGGGMLGYSMMGKNSPTGETPTGGTVDYTPRNKWNGYGIDINDY